jgi:hypothetical protein
MEASESGSPAFPEFCELHFWKIRRKSALTAMRSSLILPGMTTTDQGPFHLPARLRDAALFRPAANATFGNPDFAAASVRVLVLRLSPWRDVEASSPHLFLAQAVRRALPEAFVDFAFLPCAEDRTALHHASLPLAIGVQSRRGLAAFDLVLVSNSFTLELINLPVMLRAAGLAVWANERPENAPAIILGGSNSCAAQTLVRPDGVAMPDAFFFGEGEGAVEKFLCAWFAAKKAKSKRARLEKAASAVDGFWVTGAWPTTPVRQAVADVEPAAPVYLPLLNGETADTVRLPAAYGCPAFCAFCFEGFERKPYREIPADVLLAHARRLKVASGARGVELDAFTLNTHADAAQLIAGLARLFDRVSLKSQRADVLAAQPQMAPLERAVGKRSFTLGVEGISPRMRAFLNKSLDDAALDQALRHLFEAQVREVKLFFLITGHETSSDLAAFETLVNRLATWGKKEKNSTRLIFSFGMLVRMPGTPLRYDRLFLEREVLERTQRLCERSCERAGFEFRMAASWSEYFVSQILAAGDYRLAPLLAELADERNLFDGAPMAAYAQRLQERMEAAGIWNEDFWAKNPVSHKFPFDFVKPPVAPDFLWQQYMSAVAGCDTGYCLGETCHACGACRSLVAREELTERSRAPEILAALVAETDGLTRAKQRMKPVFLRVTLGASFSLVTPEWASARLMQIFLQALPDEADNLLSVEEAFFGAPAVREQFPLAAGETVLALKAWKPERLLEKLTTLRSDEIAIIGTHGGPTFDTFTATWKIVFDASVKETEMAVADWLKAAHLPFTLRRMADGAHYELAPGSLRKRAVFAAICRENDGRGELEIVFGPKVDLLSLLKKLPVSLEAAPAVQCLSLEWGRK